MRSVPVGAHPLAWWGWALALAVCLSRISNPFAVVALALAIVAVVYSCRDSSGWGKAFAGYLVLAAVVVLIRVGFFMVAGRRDGGAVLLRLPVIELPFGGVQLLGPVTTAGFLTALYGGLALGALLLCFGAANALADPVRALRFLPSALHPMGTAAVVAVTVAPSLMTSIRRVRRAQRLRGVPVNGWRGLPATVVPVLSDALDQALALAASMDSRGYARGGGRNRGVNLLLVVALSATVVGSYGLLDAQAPGWLGLPMVMIGACLAVIATVISGRGSSRTRYRTERWGWREGAVVAAGVGAAGLLLTSPAAHTTGLPGTAQLAAITPVAALVAMLPILWWRR
ncbi:MAG: CbiQ family ECF transporter T component [Beutenbergiaceae bacterium]